MNITAQEILNHCKAVCEGRIKSRAKVVAHGFDSFHMSYLDYGTQIWPDSNDLNIQRAVFILNLDRPSPAPVVLEWVEDEYGRPVAQYNEQIGAMCYMIASEWFAHLEIGGIQIFHFDGGTLDEARAWCEAQITKIITPTPKP